MKKILAIMLSFVIVMSGLAVPAYSAEEEISFSDNQIELLEVLNIMTKDYAVKYNSKEMTRGEFAYYVKKFAQLEDAKASGFEAIYKDVTNEHKYFSAIKALKNVGYMNGYTDGSFGPDDYISTTDAAKVLLFTIGYKPYMTASGVNAVMNKTQILSGVEIKDSIQVQDLVVLFYNTLHAPALRMVSVDSTGAKYDADDSYLGIEHLYKIVYKKGIVDGTPGTRLASPDTSISADEIMIDSVRYKYFDDNASELLGYYTEFYYKDFGNGIRNIVYITKSDRNNELVLSSADLIGFSGFTYSYYLGNKTKTASITRDTDILYNGIAYPACRDTEATPDFGQVILIDNNFDKVYDVLKIESYEFLLVNNVDTKKKVFFDQKEGISLNFSSADELNITWDGDVYPIERIIKGDFLIIKRTLSTSGFYRVDIDVRKDERTFTKVESFNTSKHTLRGGGTDYKLWDRLDADSTSNLVIDNWVTLYFCNGTVVRVEKGEGGGAKYGYLVRANKEGTFNEYIQFQLVDDSCAASVYDMGKVIYIDGTSYKAWSAIDSKLRNTATLSPHYDAAYPYAQVVKFELNGKGELLKLDTAYRDPVKENPETDLKIGPASTSLAPYKMYNQNTTIYSGEALVASIASSTIKIQVPELNRYDIEGYKKLTWGDGDPMNVEVYNLDDKIFVPEAVFGFSSESPTSPINGRTRPVIVKAKDISINSEGDIISTLTVFNQKTESVYTADENLVSMVDVGDMIRVELNDTAEIKKVEVVFDASVGKLAGGVNWIDLNTTDSYSALKPFTMGTKAIHGIAVYAKSGFLRVSSSLLENFNPTDTTKMDNLACDNALYFKYSEVRGEPVVEQASLNDVSGYALNPANPSELVMILYSNALNYVYIIDK